MAGSSINYMFERAPNRDSGCRGHTSGIPRQQYANVHRKPTHSQSHFKTFIFLFIFVVLKRERNEITYPKDGDIVVIAKILFFNLKFVINANA